MKRGQRTAAQYPHSASTHLALAEKHEKTAAGFRSRGNHTAAGTYATAARMHQQAASAIQKRSPDYRQQSEKVHRAQNRL